MTFSVSGLSAKMLDATRHFRCASDAVAQCRLAFRSRDKLQISQAAGNASGVEVGVGSKLFSLCLLVISKVSDKLLEDFFSDQQSPGFGLTIQSWRIRKFRHSRIGSVDSGDRCSNELKPLTGIFFKATKQVIQIF